MTTTEFIHKTEILEQKAKENGWTTRLVPELNDDPFKIKWELMCVRKPEALRVTYIGNRLTEATYIMGEKTLTPTHKAAVIRLLEGKPDLSKIDSTEAIKHRRIPFNPADDAAGDILDILLGKKISWVNGLSKELDYESIDLGRNRGSKHYRIIRTAENRRYIEFVTNHGFRAVYLDAIVSVS